MRCGHAVGDLTNLHSVKVHCFQLPGLGLEQYCQRCSVVCLMTEGGKMRRKCQGKETGGKESQNSQLKA